MKFQGNMRVNERGHLEIGGCDTVELAREYGTPLYVFDEGLIRETCRRYRRSFQESFKETLVLYAGKAMLTLAMVSLMDQEMMGLDVVSGGELYTAVRSGFPGERIYFHGNNKSAQELRMALENNVGHIVVDNYNELELLNSLCAQEQKQVAILLRITPGVEAHTHEYIQTGQIDSKFGFTLPNGQALEAVQTALRMEHVVLEGLHCHIGSQIFEPESFAHTARIMLRFMEQVRRVTKKQLRELNLGGGFGIFYSEGDVPPATEEFVSAIAGALHDESEKLDFPVPKVIVEPGRSIVGPAGSTLYTVGSIKEIPGVRRYLAVDGGMTDNIRPALYQAQYEAVLANRVTEDNAGEYAITGKCCESGDMLAWDVNLPEARPGDILAITCTGAYGYSMSNNYNRLLRPAAVLVSGGRADLILRRETMEDLIRNDVVPDRLCKDTWAVAGKGS